MGCQSLIPLMVMLRNEKWKIRSNDNVDSNKAMIF